MARKRSRSPLIATPPPVETAPPVATAEAPKEEAKPAPTLAELQKKTSMGIGEAMNAHDAKKLASFYTDTAILKMPGTHDVVGRDAIAADWQKHFDLVSNSKSMPTRVFVKGDVVIVEWTGPARTRAT